MTVWYFLCMPHRLAIGCMTGTSLDALDVSLVSIENSGLDMLVRHERSLSVSLGQLQPRLRHLADQLPMTAAQIAALAHDFALLHTSAIRELLAQAHAKPDLICIHGQTVFHAPPLSWQLFNPSPVAHALRCPVVSDLRAADLAAGGQGAPITPIADWVLLRNHRKGVAVVNLGGFSNATILGSPRATDLAPFSTPQHDQLQHIRAFDICACNQLLDRIAQSLMNRAFDEDGIIACSGSINITAAEDLESIFAARAGRSLGTGDESWEWVTRYRAALSPSDLAATACEAIAQTVLKAVGPTDHILIAGGGAKNRALVNAMKSGAPCPVDPTDIFSIPISFRESICFAILGALCQDRVPITLPQVTGCPDPAPVAGVWTYPG